MFKEDKAALKKCLLTFLSTFTAELKKLQSKSRSVAGAGAKFSIPLCVDKTVLEGIKERDEKNIKLLKTIEKNAAKDQVPLTPKEILIMIMAEKDTYDALCKHWEHVNPKERFLPFNEAIWPENENTAAITNHAPSVREFVKYTKTRREVSVSAQTARCKR